MALMMGIDIGTSGTKVMLADKKKGVLAVEKEQYDVSVPETGYAEQDPGIWWRAVQSCVRKLKGQFPLSDVRAVGITGQMHGLVLTDRNGISLRPAILWMDQRSESECGELRELIAEMGLEKNIRNRIFPGFALPSLLWVRHHEPEVFEKIDCVLQPKDYIRWKLTGLFGSEVSDASATLMFDIVRREWAWELIDACGFPRHIFPECHESAEIQGKISQKCAQETGIPVTADVIYGMGDQQAQSIGNGVFEEGTYICNIGTGGQISSFSSVPVYDRELRTQTFCHGIAGAYSVYGAVLNAGMALKWLKDQLIKEKDFGVMSQMAEKVPAGSRGLYFLPYLTGERTPHMDSHARGMFFGLDLSHSKETMVRAVMEGVTFALKDCMTLLEQMKLPCSRVISSGGGAASPVWLQIQADIFNRKIQICSVSEQACLGVCMAAGAAAGIFRDLQEAKEMLVSYEAECYMPDPQNAELYGRMYPVYRALYENTKDIYKREETS